MALSLHVDISKEAERAPAELQRRIAALRGARLNTQIGRGVAELFKDHLFELDRTRPNALGGKRTHFYADAAKATSSEGDDAGATITVAQQGIRQRLEGGEIRAQNGKYLTIPARAEAYGRTAREFRNLVFIKLSGDRAMLVEANSRDVSFRGGKAKGGKERGGLVYFWLVPSVHQKGDRTVLPAEAKIRARVLEIVNIAFRRLARPGGAA
jgi:hypothetical protein